MFGWLGDPIWGGIGTLFSIGKDVLTWLRSKHKKAVADNQKSSPESKVVEQNEVHGLVQRFVEIYKAHGIELTQIPRQLGEEFGLTLHDVSTDEKLLAALNENLINKTCENFGVRREWLDGKKVPIYTHRCFDKNLDAFIDFLARLKQEGKELQCLFVKCPQDKLDKGDERWPIAVVLRQEINQWGHFSEDSIWRYYPLSDQYHWGYDRIRLQLKAIVLIAWQFGIHIGGCQLPKKDVEDMVAGSVFPGPLVEPLNHVAWHPDDYIFGEGESSAVADQKEALAVREFMVKHDLLEKLISLTAPLKIPHKSSEKHLP
jgi:hypothetical protein